MTLTPVVFDGAGWLPLSGTPPLPSDDNVAPGPPQNLAVTAVSTTELLVGWGASVDADGTIVGYEVRVNGALRDTTSSLSYAVMGLAAGTEYTIAVRAVDNDGARSADVSDTGTTSADTPPATVAHGREITGSNTGHLAYVDPALGRAVLDADLIIHDGLVSLSDFVVNGATLARHWFKGGLIVDRTNVTMRACKFDQGVSGFYAGVHRQFALEWCTIDTPGAAGDDGIHYQNYTAFRCKIGGHSDAAKTNGNVTLTECFLRVEGQDSADHNDGTQNVGGNGAVTIVRCNVDVRPTNSIGAPNAALFCADGATGLQTWHDNWLAGGGYVMRLYEDATYDVQGNDVLEDSWVFGPVARAVIPSTNVTWGTARINQIVDSGGDPVSTISAP